MLVWIEQELFRTPLALTLAFVEVFALARDGRHKVLTRPPFDRSQNGPVAAWLGQMPSALAEEAEGIINAGIRSIANAPSASASITIIADDQPNWRRARLPLADAIRLLRMPLGVLLEDRRSDWNFLLRLAPPMQRESLKSAIDAGWIEVLHGGGLQSMRTLLQARLEDPALKAIDRARLHRLWVMFDRDSHPDDRRRPSPESQRIKDLCEEAQNKAALAWPLLHYQLGRRSIESYLPEQALRQWQSKGQGAEKTRRRKLIDALCELRKSWPEAARQLDMKGGLLGDVSPNVRSEVEKQGRDLRDEDLDNLFRGLPESVRKQLKNGFGGGIGKLFESDMPGFEDSFRAELDRDAQTHALAREAIIASLLARL